MPLLFIRNGLHSEETCSVMWIDTNIPESRNCFLPALRFARIYVYVKNERSMNFKISDLAHTLLQ